MFKAHTRLEATQKFLFGFIGFQVMYWLVEAIPEIYAMTPRPFLLASFACPFLAGLFCPFVPLLAATIVAGQERTPISSLRDLRMLFLPWLGAALSIYTLPNMLLSATLIYLNFQAGLAPRLGWRGGSVSDLLWSLVWFSLGVVLIFLPTLRQYTQRLKTGEAQEYFS